MHYVFSVISVEFY